MLRGECVCEEDKQTCMVVENFLSYLAMGMCVVVYTSIIYYM